MSNRIGLTTERLKILLKNHTINQIAQMYNCSYQNIRNRAIKNNLMYNKVDRTTIQMPKKYVYNEDYFENIDDEHKAYWLGFIMADGCIVQKTLNKPCLSLVINLKESDKKHLEKFRDDLNSNLIVRIFKQPAVDIKSCSGVSHVKERLGCKIEVNSKKICNDLINHNVDRRKTLKEKSPIIENENLIRHFIRGFFDGDGCFSAVKPKNRKREYAKIFISSGKEIINYIVNMVYQDTGVLMKIDTQGKLYRCYIQNEKDILSFLNYIYKDSSIFLDRKKELIDSYLSRYSLNSI